MKEQIPLLILSFLAGYFIGAIPFGYIIGRAGYGIDVREYGSGRTGFANVLRTLGVRAGIATLILDLAKGAGGAIAGAAIAGGDLLVFGKAAGAFGAVVGHNWPVYIRFRGGRGVDPALGGLFAMVPFAGAICLGFGFLTIFLSRYVSLGSILGSVVSVCVLGPLAGYGCVPKAFLLYAAAATALIIARHKDNIQRLLSGTERRIGEKGERR